MTKQKSQSKGDAIEQEDDAPRQTYRVLTPNAIIDGARHQDDHPENDVRCRVGDEVDLTDEEAAAHQKQGVALKLVKE